MKILLLDIETSPNIAHVWGLFRQNVSIKQLMESSYTMCWAAKWYKDKNVMFDSVHKSDPESMLQSIHGLLDEADAVIHYNGTRFDVPTLNKEFLLHGLHPPAPYKQIDLLKTTRTCFRFPSNKLDYVAQRLGVGKKTEHEGHQLWISCMNNDPAAWKRMEKYNKQDVVLLEKIYEKILPWVKSHPNWSTFNDRPGCTKCGSTHVHSRGVYVSPTKKYNRYQCQDCGTWMRSKTTGNEEEQENATLVSI